ncbi:MAG: twin-arginine translocase subunit TatC [Nitrososphaerota archaeon]|nr:twin-arginine translocase subunit TatC [Nitrososphaerota archaeon]
MSSEQVMSLREHLSELKRRFKIAFMSFVIILVTFLIVPANPTTFLSQGYNGFTPVIAFFISRVKLDLLPPNWHFIVVSINEPLEIYIVASVLFAMIFNSPIFAYEVIKFISPGLNDREKRLIYPFVGSTTALFAFGSFFGYFFLAKFLLAALTPFFLFTGVNPPQIDAANFYFIVFLTIGMSGIAFTVPVYIYTLIRFGVIQATTFTKNRIIVWAVTYILCAIITPDGGPFLDVLLFIPIISLLELAVFIGGRHRRAIVKRNEEEQGYGTSPAPSAPGRSSPVAPGPVVSSPPAPATAEATPATGTRCPYCSFPVAPGTVFCPNCGKAIQ